MTKDQNARVSAAAKQFSSGFVSGPWMEPEEIEVCKKLVTDKRVFEYGSGGSTVVYGGLAREYYSIETNRDWYESVKTTIENRKELKHVKIFYERDKGAYLQKIKDIGGTFDVILVDNDLIPRAECALKALDFLKEGGTLLIHDATIEEGDRHLYRLREEFMPVLKKFSPTNLSVRDGLDKLPEIKVCTGYKLDGETLDYVPTDAEDIERVKPVYQTFRGWRCDTTLASFKKSKNFPKEE